MQMKAIKSDKVVYILVINILPLLFISFPNPINLHSEKYKNVKDE